MRKSQTTADNLEKLLKLRRMTPAKGSLTHVPTRDDMLDIVTLPREEFKSELKLLIDKYRYWESKANDSRKHNYVTDLEAQNSMYSIAAALSDIEENVETYLGIGKGRKEPFLKRASKPIAALAIGGVASYFAISAIPPVSQYLQKESHLSQFRAAINAYDGETSQKIFEDMQASGLVGDIEIVGLEKKIASISEQSLSESMSSASSTKRLALAQKYLELYPQGDNRLEAASAILNESVIKLVSGMAKNKDYEQVLNQLRYINVQLRKYDLQPSEISSDLPAKEINKLAKQYLQRTHWIPDTDDKINMGDSVKVVTSANNVPSRYSSSYVSARNNAFPSDSVGKVIDTLWAGVMVKFDDEKKLHWRDSWLPCKNRWGADISYIGGFEPYELQPIAPLNSAHIRQFEKELEILENRFGR